MKKSFVALLLVAMMSTSTVFAFGNGQATNTESLFYTAGDQVVVAKSSSNFVKLKKIVEKDLHARTATEIVKEVTNHDAIVTISREERSVSARSLLSILSLGICAGVEVEVTAEGPDAREVANLVLSYL